jgi:hypothetical protein
VAQGDNLAVTSSWKHAVRLDINRFEASEADPVFLVARDIIFQLSTTDLHGYFSENAHVIGLSQRDCCFSPIAEPVCYSRLRAIKDKAFCHTSFERFFGEVEG